MSPWESQILTLGDDTVLVECGPMRMFLEGLLRGIPRPDLCQEAALRAIGFLDEVAADMHLLQAPAVLGAEPAAGSLAHVMWAAARLVGDADLTPMAAVAGTIADAAADFLEQAGLTRIIVNNGGDLALRLEPGEKLSVGIRPDVDRGEISHRVVVTADMGVRGICTSGFGGRSFTRGVASAATVFASCAAVADAAASAVANATYVSSPEVVRTPADQIDPNTDLKGVDVTKHVGTLSERETETALSQGIDRAEDLVRRGVILGACIVVKGRLRSTSAISGLIERLEAQPRTLY
jgi:uncharacterized protein